MESFILCYFLVVLWGGLVCVIIPGIFFLAGMDSVGHTFPDSPGGMGVLFFGWLPAFVGCFAIWLLKLIVVKVKKRKDVNMELQNKSD